MPSRSVRLVVGTPCYGGQITTLFALSLLKLQQACLARSMDFGAMLLSGDALITRARQNLVAHFLNDSEATHLLFIDADISFSPEQVFRLLDFGESMTAAIYPTKRFDLERYRTLANAAHPNPEASALNYVVEYDIAGATQLRDGFIKVRYTGTGFLLIERGALIAMIEHYPELRYRSEHQAEDPLRNSPWRSALFNCFIDQSSGVYLSEDFAFCRRWTDMGRSIWADTNSQLGHSGSFIYRGDFRASFSEEQIDVGVGKVLADSPEQGQTKT